MTSVRFRGKGFVSQSSLQVAGRRSQGSFSCMSAAILAVMPQEDAIPAGPERNEDLEARPERQAVQCGRVVAVTADRDHSLANGPRVGATEDQIEGVGVGDARAEARGGGLGFERLNGREAVEPPRLRPGVIDPDRIMNFGFEGRKAAVVGLHHPALVLGLLVRAIPADPARQALQDAFQDGEEALDFAFGRGRVGLREVRPKDISARFASRAMAAASAAYSEPLSR